MARLASPHREAYDRAQDEQNDDGVRVSPLKQSLNEERSPYVTLHRFVGHGLDLR
jgi:hypothetical protein